MTNDMGYFDFYWIEFVTFKSKLSKRTWSDRSTKRYIQNQKELLTFPKLYTEFYFSEWTNTKARESLWLLPWQRSGPNLLLCSNFFLSLWQLGTNLELDGTHSYKTVEYF